jgi:hypothetical protein
MPCKIDPLLETRHIRIDNFARPKQEELFFVTHAHADHMSGLDSNSQKNNMIFCSKITKDLIRMKLPFLTNFTILSPYKSHQVLPDTKVFSIDSFHCDGSYMFLFVIGKEATRILYTGDFRFHPQLRSNKVLSSTIIDKIYFDDTFVDISYTNPYPNYFETYQVILHHIEEIRKMTNDAKVPIFIHTSIVGLECILRQLGATLHENFSISKGTTGLRRRQLAYLLPGQINHKSPLILADRKKDDLKKGYWIIPTATHFLCPIRKKPHTNNIYVWFSTHPSKYEILRLISIAGVIEENTIPCNFSVSPLVCKSQK